jgi:xanthine dehydrogenase accessory factor
MKNVLQSLLVELENDQDLVLVTILSTKGSTPQVTGASALFSNGILRDGTLGGGILEADATRRSAEFFRKGSSIIYEFSLNANITAESGAICGGSAILLLDARPGMHRAVFDNVKKSVTNGIKGILATLISGREKVTIERCWLENGKLLGKNVHKDLKELEIEMAASLQNGDCLNIQKNDGLSIYLQPVYPMPKLIIAGAGHIGKALSHLAKLLDFEVTVIDDRPEYANPQNIPDADHIMVDNIGNAVRKIPANHDTYIVIVTRGHRDDTEALKACINSDLPYIGMIGSKRKVSLIRENFILKGWATTEQFDRIHAPVGLDINSKTVQEIAVSICAQLIQVRNQDKLNVKAPVVNAIILAAGESKRMGKPKMTLPFGDKSIIEKVVSHATHSVLDKIIVVLGSDAEPVRRLLQEYAVKTVLNNKYKDGMLSSVQCGLSTVSPTTDGVMILLGDQPMVSSSVIDKVLDAFKRSGKDIIIATCGKKRGHPILIGRKYFQEVMEFPAEKTLKDLLIKYPGDIEEVETGSPEILRDIDTHQEYLAELKNNNNYD